MIGATIHNNMKHIEMYEVNLGSPLQFRHKRLVKKKAIDH